jgi:DNA-binding winged helix-turn-helix (wHTH) protein
MDVGVAPSADGRLVHSFSGFRIDPLDGLERDGVRIPLAPTEGRVLAVLVAAGGRIVTKDQLTEQAWSGAAASDNSISRAICAIRRALRLYTDEQVVETVYGVGFRIAVPVELAPAPWRARPAPARTLPSAALACLTAARELLRRGRPADVPHAAAELDRAVRLLGGEDSSRAEPAG